MEGEKARQLIKKSQDAISAAIEDAEASGALRHLYGQRLDLSDDSPEWFTRKLLKREGLAPPLLERSKELDIAHAEADAIIERLRRRRAWLVSLEGRCTGEQAEAFNATRRASLAEYRVALDKLNRAIRDYNLVAPLPLQRRGYRVDRIVDQVSADVPPLDVPIVEMPVQASRRTWLRFPWRRRSRREGR